MNPDVSKALAALQVDPANPDALEALSAIHPGNGSGVPPEALAAALADARRFHRERGDHALCVQLIDLELNWTTDAARRADLMHEKAHLLADDLLDENGAVECLNRALEAAPGHAAATQSLAQIALVRENWERIAAKYIEDARAATDRSLQASLYASVAEFYWKYRPAGREAEDFLRRSVDADPRYRKAAMHLERLLKSQGRADELVTFYDKRIENAASREDRAAAEVAAGEVALRGGRSAVALEHFKRALAADPAQPRALALVVEALTVAGAWTDLVKVFETALRASKRAEPDQGLILQLAMILWKKLAQVDQAELYFRRLRKADARHPAMLDFYREYHAARNELPQLLAVLAQAQKTEPDPARRVQIGVEMAQAAEQVPQSVEKAIDLWKAVLRLQPRLPEAMAALKRLFGRTEKWNALLELLKDEAEALPADAVDEKIAHYLDIVAIYRDRLNLDVMVTNTYGNILALRPNHPTALQALADRYEAQGRWNDLIQILGRQAEATDDVHMRIGLQRRIAQIWVDRFGKHQNAVTALETILSLDPSDAEARERLKDLYARGRNWRALLEVQRKELPFLPPEVRRARLGEMARLAAERMGDAREAIALWNDALAAADRDPEALQALAALYEREKRWAALAEILDRQRQLAAGDLQAEAVLLERRGALLAEKLGAVPAAVEAWRRVQQLQPSNPRATRALREIYAQAGDFPALEALYAEQGGWAELCETLSSIADRTVDLAARTRLLERVAELSLTRLDQPERALKAYERILATEPHNRAAASKLVPLYRAAEKWPRLLATYELLLGQADALDADERLRVLQECQTICELRLGSKALAFQWCARAWELAPEDAGIVATLERLAAEADEWAVLAGLYARRLESLAPGPARVALLRRQMHIALVRLYRPAEARAAAEEVLQIAPDDEEATAALEQIFTHGEAWADLAGVLHRRARRCADVTQRIELLFRAAALEEEQVGDRAAAARSLAAIVETDATSTRALRALVRVREVEGDWAGLADALARAAALHEGDERADLLLRLGEVQETRLGDAEAAFASYRDVLALDPVRKGAVAGLERLVEAEPARRADVAVVVAPFYERSEDGLKLAGALEAQLGAATGADARLGLLRRLATLYGRRLRDAAAAYGAALRIFELDAGDADNRESLVALAAETGRLEELAERMRSATDACQDPALRRNLLVERAELHEQRLGRAGEAEGVYREILDVDPLHDGAWKALSRLYRDGEQWTKLRDLMEARQGRVADAGERLDLLAQVAEIDESVLEAADHAVETYRRMLELAPGDLRAYRALDRHYSAGQRWADLEALLDRQAGFAGKDEQVTLAYRRAELRFLQLGQTDGALDLLESALASAPDHEGARFLAERAMALPAQRVRAARILERAYERTGSWPRLVAALEAQLEALSGADAARLLARIAGVHEGKLSARAAAFDTWRRALSADAHMPGALVELERLAAVLERFDDLVPVYVDLAERLDPADLLGRAELLGRAARVQTARLGDRAAAIATWRRIIDLDPSNLETARPAAAALEQLFAETGDAGALVGVLRLQIEWSEDAATRVALLFRVAGLEETALGDATAAAATLRSILEEDAENAGALDHLERQFEAGRNHAGLVEILRRRLELAADVAGRRELRRRLGEILERDLGDVDEAIATHMAVLDETPDDPAALEALARLYESRGRHGDRLEVLERRLALTQAPAERVEGLRRIGAMLAGPLARPAEALERWREILELSPTDAEALASVEYVLGGEGELRLAAARLLEPVYEAAGRWQRLAHVVGIFADAEDDRRQRIGHLVRLAGLQETRLRNLDAAFRSYGRAIRDAVAEPELAGLLDAYERLGGAARLAEIVTTYREIAPDVMADDARLRLDRFIAESARRLGERDLGIEHWRKVLDRLPDDAKALQALEQLYAEGDETAALYEILLRRADLATGDVKMERLHRARLAPLAETLGHTDDAIAAWERVWELRPGDEDAVAHLDRMYSAGERWADLENLLGRLLALGMPERAAVGVHYRLAELAFRRQHDAERAIEHLRVVMAGGADHASGVAMLEEMLADITVQAAAAELLEPVYAGRQAWRDLIRIDEIRLSHAEDDPARRLAWTKRIARLHEEQLEEPGTAFRWYGKVFLEAPADHWAREQLLRLAAQLDKWDELAHLLAGYLGNEYGDDPATLEIVRLTAEIFDRRVGDAKEARRFYRRLVEARPDDPEMAALFEAALERWEAWRELRDVVEERAGRSPEPAQRKDLLRRCAWIDEERLLDKERAAATLRGILEIDADDVAAAAELERLLRAGERWFDLSEHLSLMLGRAATDADRDGIAFRLADVHEHHLGDVGTAVDRYEEIVARTPAHRGAIAALERLILDQEQRYRIAQTLESVYRNAGELQKLVVILETQLEILEEPSQRVPTLHEIAEIHERMGRLDLAFDARRRAWLADVTAPDTLAALEELGLRNDGRYAGGLVAALQEGAARAPDGDLQATLWGMAAQLCEERLRDPAPAVDAWRKALEARRDDVGALQALERLLAAASRMSELVETIEQHIEISADPEERKALGKRAAVLYEQALKQRDSAIGAWRAVLDIDAADEEALDALGRLFVAGQAWRDLSGIYQRKIEMAREPGPRRLLRVLSARLHDEHLGEPSEAVSQLRALLDESPGDEEGLDMLDRVLTREGQHAELLEVLDMRAESAAHAADRDQHAMRAAELCEGPLSDVEAAVARFRGVLERTPAHAGAREALWRHARGTDHRAAAVAALEPVLRAEGDVAGLIELLDLRLAVEEAPGLRYELLAEIGRLEEERGETRRSFDAWARALAEDAADAPARSALERLALALGDPAALARVFEERLEATFDAVVQRSLALRLADLYETSLSDLAAAAAKLRKVLELPGDEREPLAALERVLRALPAWPELAEILAREAEIAPEATTQAGFLAALGDVRLRRLSDVDGAVAAFRASLERDASQSEPRAALAEIAAGEAAPAAALEVLEPLAEARGDFTELAALYERRAALEDGRAERVMWLRRIAEIAETRLGDAARAVDVLGRALGEEPAPGAAADDIERIAVAAGMPVEAARRLEAAATAAEPSAGRELALRAARLYAQSPADQASAERLYARVLGDEPDNREALAALEAFYRAAADAAKLAGILERRAGAEMDPTVRRAVTAEAARLREGLGDEAAAVQGWEAVRRDGEGDVEALDELARLYERTGRHKALAEILAERARFADEPARRSALLARVGELKAAEGDVEAAADAYREALDGTPNDPALLAALELLHERRGDHAALQEVLLRRLAGAVGRDQVGVLERLARNAEANLHDVDQAIGYLHQILGLEPASAPAFVALERILGVAERWYDLVDVLARHAEQAAAAGETAEELRLRVAAADLWEQRLDSPESAAETLEKVLERDPANLPALLSVARLHEAGERWTEASSALERAAALVAGPEAAEIHCRMGKLLSAQGQTAAADEALLRALDCDPVHAPTLAALEANARGVGDQGRLAQILELRENAMVEPADKRKLLLELVEIYTGPLGQPAAALPFLERLAALVPDEAGLQERLADALLAAGRADEAERIIVGLVERLGKQRRGKELSRWQQRLGAIAEARGDQAAASERYNAAYQIDPGDAATLAALARLAVAQNDGEKARRYYRSLLLQSFDEKAAGISKADVYAALGKLHLDAGENAKARNMFERGLETEPKHETLRALLAQTPK